MLNSFSYDVGLATSVITAGFALIAVWARLRWRKLKPTLFPDKSIDSSPNPLASGGTIESADILRMIRNWLAGQGSPAAARALAALATIEGPGWGTDAVDKLFSKALETDDVASLLIR